MNRDTFESVLEDCTLDPVAYCRKHGLSATGSYRSFMSFIADMCADIAERAWACGRESAENSHEV